MPDVWWNTNSQSTQQSTGESQLKYLLKDIYEHPGDKEIQLRNFTYFEEGHRTVFHFLGNKGTVVSQLVKYTSALFMLLSMKQASSSINRQRSLLMNEIKIKIKNLVKNKSKWFSPSFNFIILHSNNLCWRSFSTKPKYVAGWRLLFGIITMNVQLKTNIYFQLFPQYMVSILSQYDSGRTPSIKLQRGSRFFPSKANCA